MNFAPEARSCSAISTAYAPPLVRGIRPNGTLTTSIENMVVWKQAQAPEILALPSATSASDGSPSKSSMQTAGIEFTLSPRSARTAVSLNNSD